MSKKQETPEEYEKVSRPTERDAIIQSFIVRGTSKLQSAMIPEDAEPISVFVEGPYLKVRCKAPPGATSLKELWFVVLREGEETHSCGKHLGLVSYGGYPVDVFLYEKKG